MAAPIYSQAQVVAMMAMPKYVRYDAWEGRWSGRESSVEVRHRIRCYPIDEAEPTQFSIESCHCLEAQEVSFTLFGKLIGYIEYPLCRYEVQNVRHTNPIWYSPRYVRSRELHKHVYSERAIREGFSWDKCADVVGDQVESAKQAIDRLTPLFLRELSIEIHDRDVRKGLFGQ